MRGFLYQLPKNIIRCFKGNNLLWHFLAIVLTYIIVTSDFDWHYFISSQKSVLHTLFFPAISLGMILPIVVPLILLATGIVRQDFKIKQTAFALGQAAMLGLGISAFYKAFTGRIPPPYFPGPGVLVDTSHGFFARRNVLGLALFTHYRCVRHGRCALEIISSEQTCAVRDHVIRVLCGNWCLD